MPPAELVEHFAGGARPPVNDVGHTLPGGLVNVRLPGCVEQSLIGSRVPVRTFG